MLFLIIYVLFSFLLEGFMSNIFASSLTDVSYFTTIYTVISFVVIYPYFYNKKKYYILLIIFGILFDALYTSTFIVNVFIFLGIGFVIYLLNNILSDNIFMINIISIIAIITYHLLSFIILSIAGYANYSFLLLGRIIVHSIIMTIIYTSLSYLIIKTLFNRFDIKEIK